ncbi:MAG: TIGR00730 family Rossman fold protein [Candidatus Doudnabacteria bacterium]|nr:TIGR00730 family Rossman fold protein [Candidatus Doudnabacteria bacterium]
MPKFKHPNDRYLDTKYTVDRVKKEINSGIRLLNQIKVPIVSFFGSHKTKPTSPYYKQAMDAAYMLGRCGYAIETGGGPGIMKAANQGATKAHAPSIGIMAGLIKTEKVKDEIFTKHLSYHFLFVRRFVLSIKSDALIFFPGGYGTLNELFEYIVLIQLHFINKVPIILVGKKYWAGLFEWLKDQPGRKDYFIKHEHDLNLVQFCDTTEEIVSLIEKECAYLKPKSK